jgi:hypothetical protein
MIHPHFPHEVGATKGFDGRATGLGKENIRHTNSRSIKTRAAKVIGQ